MWTGSGSKGNGGVYYYYHCQNGCKERARASEANLALQSYLQTFRVCPEVQDLYLVIMEDIFKTKEGDKESQLAQLKKELEKLQEKLRKIADKFVMDDIDKVTFDLLRKPVLEEENRLKQKYTQLERADTNFMRYCNYGISLLSHLDKCYAGASPAVQKKLLGSIFTGKLIFKDGNYRTTGLNAAVELIGLF
ncbi:MAG: hypothetical protein S4CHLAM2_09820 [Chlamydiales bacterium]|nr:hypothetical protein [Chlamydiales bacterium]